MAGLVALTGGAWFFILTRDATMASHYLMPPTMGMSELLFLLIWVAMMIATMFPSAAPMILMFAHISTNKRTTGQAFVSTWFFAAGYLFVWTISGVLAYFLARFAEWLGSEIVFLSENAGRIGGAVILAAGGYQFSGVKDRCLTKCRSPLAFVMENWRDGHTGAILMGILHGLYCAGCCWAFMVVMFPLGMMSIATLVTVTTLIYAEKVLPAGRLIRILTGLALLTFGIAVLVEPSLLSGQTTPH